MLSLVPDWAQHYGEFWRAIRARNLWFIKLRYFAIVILTAFLLTGELLLNFRLTPVQVQAISTITLVILCYNLLIHKYRLRIGCDPNKFNCLHTSLFMIILDLVALLLLVYFTGSIDSPLCMLFVFHMIIGSLILPGYIVYMVAGLISLSFAVLIAMEHNSVISNHKISGIINRTAYHTTEYELLFVLTFSFMLFVSVYITNKIARQLFQREQQLRESLEKLNEAENTKQRYTLGVVHEIKTPVAAVKSIVDLLLGNYVGPLSAEIEEKLLRARLRSEEALLLINDVLQFSRIKLLDINLNEIIKVEQMISQIIDMHTEEVKEKNIKLIFSDKRKIERVLFGAPLLLELAFSNIISNAIKYTQHDGEVFIILREDANIIEIEISDNGIGIPAKEQRTVFEHFYRATNVNKASIEGSGMGLSITKEIITKHQGTIEVTSPSKIGNIISPGTTVIIKLPYRQPGVELDTVTYEEYS
ncbi:MAG: HAMP domain-containing histidine kinase [Ignavibacteriales bacterium]|nr:HAMP domain-containing histidine kinase [Ignavibacteriales bacterium]